MTSMSSRSAVSAVARKLIVALLLLAAVVWTESWMVPRVRAAAMQTQGSGVVVDADNIGGVVTSAKGPEAGVWVIAETNDLGTKFRKIVVTDERGRYLLPELPKATYKVWVRGYGLVDSAPVTAAPGTSLALTAVVAPDARAAAQYYPGNYWYSLLQIPPKSAFPMKMPPVRAADRPERFLDCRGGGATGCEERGGGMALAGFTPDDLKNGYVASNQAEYIYTIKRTCNDCHQIGNKITREINPALGHFASSTEAWERMLKSGQTGGLMMAAVDVRFGHERGLALFADWSDRIAAGEVPVVPPRPQGVERNVVLSMWEFGTERAFIHDIAASNGMNQTANAYGKIYGTDNASGMVEWVDPVANTKGRFEPPPTPNNPNKALPSSLQYNEAPSPFWGDELVWNERGGAGGPQIDPLGRLWYSARPLSPATFCGKGSDNPFAKNFPVGGGGLGVYDPKTGQQTVFPMCGASGSHRAWANDADRTLYAPLGVQSGGFAWIKTRVWDETHDVEKAIGWCPGILDYNGDGKIGAYTLPGEPADPTLDRMFPVGGLPYGVGSSPVDGSFWVVGGVLGGPKTAVPGRIMRCTRGANPPATCTMEVYEPPFNNPKAPGVEGYTTQGVEVDSQGVTWVILGGSGHIASFDRRKCKVLRGPTATGQHCPEGWTLYPVPGPTFKGTDVKSDYFYLGWVDRDGALGLGKDVPIANGTGSDSLIAYLPDQKKFITLRVPYPMDFYTRSMSGRIDDPKAGWKGRGVWAGNNERVVWNIEGGKGNTSQVVHFQVRPDPLAR